MSDTHMQVLVIGGGLSGVGAAIRLADAGIDDVVVLEKAASLGGTWRENTYPGCGCDVPSAVYSFSFAPNPDWSRVFARQPEIERYVEDIADRFGVRGKVRFGVEALEGRWDAERQRWLVDTNAGRFVARFVIAAAGPLHQPATPDLPGLDDFAGEAFHSAEWDHDLDLRGRRVAVVGTGASAIQLVPEIQPEVEHLTVFQRTPPWVLPKPDRPVLGVEKLVYRHVPFAQRAVRESLYHSFELLQLAQRRPSVMRRLSLIGKAHLFAQVRDGELRAKLTPDYALGCKRILMSNSYYGALTAENASVVAHGVREVTPDGVIDATGTHHAVDTLIFATGFDATDPPIARRVFDAEGRSLAELSGGTPEAYLGTMATGFPNAFILIGPNTGNGHQSATVIVEAQLRFLIDAIRHCDRHGLAALDVRPEAQARFNDEVQEALAGTVWNSGGCASWYLDDEGKNRTIYPWTTIDLRRRLRGIELADFTQVPAIEPVEAIA